MISSFAGLFGEALWLSVVFSAKKRHLSVCHSRKVGGLLEATLIKNYKFRDLKKIREARFETPNLFKSITGVTAYATEKIETGEPVQERVLIRYCRALGEDHRDYIFEPDTPAPGHKVAISGIKKLNLRPYRDPRGSDGWELINRSPIFIAVCPIRISLIDEDTVVSVSDWNLSTKDIKGFPSEGLRGRYWVTLDNTQTSVTNPARPEPATPGYWIGETAPEWSQGSTIMETTLSSSRPSISHEIGFMAEPGLPGGAYTYEDFVNAISDGELSGTIRFQLSARCRSGRAEVEVVQKMLSLDADLLGSWNAQCWEKNLGLATICSRHVVRSFGLFVLVLLVATQAQSQGLKEEFFDGSSESNIYIVVTPSGAWTTIGVSGRRLSVEIVDDQTGETISSVPLTPCPEPEISECKEPYQASVIGLKPISPNGAGSAIELYPFKPQIDWQRYSGQDTRNLGGVRTVTICSDGTYRRVGSCPDNGAIVFDNFAGGGVSPVTSCPDGSSPLAGECQNPWADILGDIRKGSPGFSDQWVVPQFPRQ